MFVPEALGPAIEPDMDNNRCHPWREPVSTQKGPRPIGMALNPTPEINIRTIRKPEESVLEANLSYISNSCVIHPEPISSALQGAP